MSLVCINSLIQARILKSPIPIAILGRSFIFQNKPQSKWISFLFHSPNDGKYFHPLEQKYDNNGKIFMECIDAVAGPFGIIQQRHNQITKLKVLLFYSQLWQMHPVWQQSRSPVWSDHNCLSDSTILLLTWRTPTVQSIRCFLLFDLYDLKMSHLTRVLTKESMISWNSTRYWTINTADYSASSDTRSRHLKLAK